MKKLMAMILTLAMVMSLCVVPASAADGKVTITITPDTPSVDTATGDAVVTYTVKAKVTDSTLKVGALTITLDPGAGLELAAQSKDNEPAFFYEENQSLYYHKNFSPSGIFGTEFSYAPLTKTFVAVGATNDRNLNSTHGEVVLMTIMGKIAQGTTGTVTLGTTTCTYGDVMAEASHDCDVTPATVTISKAPITSVSATVSQPVKGYPLDTSVNVYGATAYDATVIWKDVEENMTATGNAQPGKIYTALITLKAKEGETFATSLNNTTTPDGYTIQMLNSTELLLTKEFDRIPVKDATGIAIDNTTLTVAVPTAEPNTEQKAELPLTAKVNYDDGTNETVDASWSIVDPKPEGVDIDKDTGKLTVTNKAAGGNVRVLATFEGKTDRVNVTITKDTPTASAIVATPPATGTNITIPNGGSTSSGQCSYKVYDQYGAEMPGISATWKMKLEPTTVTGVTLTTDGAIAVTNDATTCTATVYAEGSGVKSNEITFNITREDSVAKSLTIEGTIDSVNVPTVSEPGTTKCEYAAYTAKVLDQYGTEMTGKTIEWSVTENPGVTINNGQLTVTNKADAGTVTITAKSGTLTATKTVTINKDEAKVSIVKITAQGGATPVTIITCTGSQRSESYTATVYDQYGNEKQDNVTWSLNSTLSGVNYEVSATNGNIVTLKVAPNADEGTFKLVATSQTITTVKGELEIKVQKKNDVSGKINFANGSLTYNGAGQEYKAATLDSTVTAGTDAHWAYTYAVKTGSTGTLDAANLPKTVGTYTVTVTYEDSKNVGSKTVELTIGPKAVTVSGITAENKKYDGKNTATVNADGATFTGIVSGDKLTITATGTFADTDVGDGKTVTLTLGALGGTSVANYTLAATDNQTTTTASITAKEVTLTGGINATNRNYVKDNTTVELTKGALTFTGLVSGETLDVNIPTTGTISDDKAGTYNVAYSGVTLAGGTGKASNYTLNATLPAVTVNITKADAPKLKDITVSQKYTVTTGEKAIGAVMPTDAGALTYTKGTESKTGSVTVTDWKVDATGKVTYTLSSGAAGDTVTLPVTIGSDNYENAIVYVKITLTKPSYSGGGSYTPSYTVSVDKTENGTITVSPKSASKGDTVTITVKPDKGYELDTLKVLDKDGDKVKLTEKNGKYTFKMPSGKVTVKGSFVEEAPVQIFKDVPTDAYYYEAVKWAAEKGITGGVGNGLFAPNQPCTRAQIVTFLWRAAGSPAPKNMSSFTDVPADAFYAKAVAWAVENGITGGTGDGKFSPDATCTRAQSVTFLYRAAGSPKVSSSAEFGDVATNTYYADAVAWAAKNGITGGIGGGLFGSNNDCTRAQIVTFLYRCVK